MKLDSKKAATLINNTSVPEGVTVLIIIFLHNTIQTKREPIVIQSKHMYRVMSMHMYCLTTVIPTETYCKTTSSTYCLR